MCFEYIEISPDYEVRNYGVAAPKFSMKLHFGAGNDFPLGCDCCLGLSSSGWAQKPALMICESDEGQASHNRSQLSLPTLSQGSFRYSRGALLALDGRSGVFSRMRPHVWW